MNLINSVLQFPHRCKQCVEKAISSIGVWPSYALCDRSYFLFQKYSFCSSYFNCTCTICNISLNILKIVRIRRQMWICIYIDVKIGEHIKSPRLLLQTDEDRRVGIVLSRTVLGHALQFFLLHTDGTEAYRIFGPLGTLPFPSVAIWGLLCWCCCWIYHITWKGQSGFFDKSHEVKQY